MKRWMIAGLVCLASGVMHAQSVDSTRTGPRGAAGVSQRMDKFVDKDGDGICDDRVSGLGFRRAGRGMNRMMNISGTGTGEGTGAGAAGGAGSGSSGMGRGKKFQKGQKQ